MACPAQALPSARAGGHGQRARGKQNDALGGGARAGALIENFKSVVSSRTCLAAMARNLAAIRDHPRGARRRARWPATSARPPVHHDTIHGGGGAATRNRPGPSVRPSCDSAETGRTTQERAQHGERAISAHQRTATNVRGNGAGSSSSRNAATQARETVSPAVTGILQPSAESSASTGVRGRNTRREMPPTSPKWNRHESSCARALSDNNVQEATSPRRLRRWAARIQQRRPPAGANDDDLLLGTRGGRPRAGGGSSAVQARRSPSPAPSPHPALIEVGGRRAHRCSFLPAPCGGRTPPPGPTLRGRAISSTPEAGTADQRDLVNGAGATSRRRSWSNGKTEGQKRCAARPGKCVAR